MRLPTLGLDGACWHVDLEVVGWSPAPVNFSLLNPKLIQVYHVSSPSGSLLYIVKVSNILLISQTLSLLKK